MSEWKKDKADRGVFLRGKVWYIKYYDQTGKLRRERVGSSKALARKVYQKRKTEIHERRYFPSSTTTIDDLLKMAIAEVKRRHQLKKSNHNLGDYRYNRLGEWFKDRRACTITTEEIERELQPLPVLVKSRLPARDREQESDRKPGQLDRSEGGEQYARPISRPEGRNGAAPLDS
jgi:hypothetical protein